MKLKYVLAAALCLISIKVNAKDYYAPWTRSTIVNNTKYPVKVSLYYSIPGCTLVDVTTGKPCSVRGGTCDYNQFPPCVPNSSQQYTLKASSMANPVLSPSDAVIEGKIDIAGRARGTDAIIIELSGNSTVAPVQIDNPGIKKYTVNFDGKKLTVTQSPLK